MPVAEDLATRPLDRAELLRDLEESLSSFAEPPAAPADELEQVFVGKELTEEEPEETLVAQVVQVPVAAEPLRQRAPAVGRQLVHAAAPAAVRLFPGDDESRALERRELGVDLSVARPPEEPRREVRDTLDVVAGARPPLEEPENDAGSGVEG